MSTMHLHAQVMALQRFWHFGSLALCWVVLMVLPLAPVRAEVPRLPEPLCDYRNVTEEAFREAELDCIKKAGVPVERDGERLIVEVKGNVRSIKYDYTDNRAACDGISGVSVDYCVYYTFLGYLPNINSVVISKGCYESCQDVMLVSLTSGGAPIIGEAIPQFSPDRSMFIIVAAGEAGDGIRTPDIQLFEVLDQKPVLVFRYRSPLDMYEVQSKGKFSMMHSYEYWKFLRWGSNTEVELTVGARGAGCHKNTDLTIKLQKATEMAWKFSPGPPCR
jgi:hypothetical protein